MRSRNIVRAHKKELRKMIESGEGMIDTRCLFIAEQVLAWVLKEDAANRTPESIALAQANWISRQRV